MFPFYHLFRPKTRKSSLDEITLLAIQYWDNFRSVQTIGGIPLYISKNGNNTELQYSTVKMKISPTYGDGIDVSSCGISYDDISNPKLRRYKSIIKIDMNSQKVCLFTNVRATHMMSSTEFDIKVPFDMMNEIDFFQYETLNPVLPISREVLVKLVQTIIKDIT